MSKWLTYTPTSGHKNGTIDVTASLNDTNAVRSAVLTIANMQYGIRKRALIRQRSSAMPIILTLDTTNFTWEGGDFILNVQCQGAWSLDAPVNITLDTYEGFGNASVSGHLSYNFGSESARFTISGDSGRIYYDSIDLTEGGLDTTNNTVYRYTAYKYAADSEWYKGVNPNNHIWGDACMEVVQAGFYKGYKNGVEVPFRHLTDQYTGDSAVIWDDIIDSVDIRYSYINSRDETEHYNNENVRRIDGISNLVELLPYTYVCQCGSGGAWRTITGWRLTFYRMAGCEYADMRNIIPQDGWWDMGCMFHYFNGVLDCSTWSFRNISNMEDFIGGGALNIRSMERNGVRAAINSMSSANLLGRVIAADDLNPVRVNVFFDGAKAYYPSAYEEEWLPYINYYTGVEFTPYDEASFLICPDMNLSFSYSKKISKIYPVFSSSDWTCRVDSSWFSVEKVHNLGFKVHLKENYDDVNRVGHIYFTNEDGITTVVEVKQGVLFYLAYTTTDGKPLDFVVYGKNGGFYETYQNFVDDEWRLYLVEDVHPIILNIYGLNISDPPSDRLQEFRGASTECTLMRLSFKNCTNLERVNMKNISLLYENQQMMNIFNGCTALKQVDDWGFLSRIERTDDYWSYSGMFQDCRSLTYADISALSPSVSTTGTIPIYLLSMFNGCTALMEVKMGDGLNNTGRQVRTNSMFRDCSSLKEFDAPSLCVDDCTAMFRGCHALQKVAMGYGLAEGMYYDCWDLKSVTYTEEFAVEYSFGSLESAFENCESLEQIDLSKVDFTSTRNINRFFYNCRKLNTVKFGVNAYFSYSGRYSALGSNHNNIFDNTAGGTILIPTNAVTTNRAGWDIRNQTDHFYPEDKWTVVKY